MENSQFGGVHHGLFSASYQVPVENSAPVTAAKHTSPMKAASGTYWVKGSPGGKDGLGHVYSFTRRVEHSCATGASVVRSPLARTKRQAGCEVSGAQFMAQIDVVEHRQLSIVGRHQKVGRCQDRAGVERYRAARIGENADLAMWFALEARHLAAAFGL